MATGQLGVVFRQFGRLFGAGTVCGLSEDQLLDRFVDSKDEAAFEALVKRFGPMVLGVCRQVLNDPHAAEDAFQATFLVLVKRARTIRNRDLLGNWLYGVALKVAKRSRADLARRKSREAEARSVASEPVGDEPARDDLDFAPALHAELSRLPEKYRAPMVLCFLEGQTCEQAAARLGWPVGTVKGRISRAKELLRGRLARRGVTASVAMVAATLHRAAEASVSPVLLDQTVKAAMGLAAGGAAVAAGLASASAVALADGVGTTMMISKIKAIAAGLAIVATMATGAGVMARQFGSGGQRPGDDKTKTADRAKERLVTPDPVAAMPTFEDRIRATPLPSIDPMGKLLAKRVAAAKQELEAMAVFYEQGSVTLDRLVQAATSYRDARMNNFRTDGPARIKALEEHVRLLQGIVDREESRFKVGQGSIPNVTEAESARLEAMIALVQERAGRDSTPKPGIGGIEMGPFEVAAKNVPAKTDPNAGAGEVSDDPIGDSKIFTTLDQAVSMPFGEGTPLGDVLKYIETATTGPDWPQGLPVYLDPDAFETTGKTLESPIKLSLEGIKLKTTLRLALKQVGLGYFVKHGLVMIGALDDEEYLDTTRPGWRGSDEGGPNSVGTGMEGAAGSGGFGGGGEGFSGGGGGFR